MKCLCGFYFLFNWVWLNRSEAAFVCVHECEQDCCPGVPGDENNEPPFAFLGSLLLAEVLMLFYTILKIVKLKVVFFWFGVEFCVARIFSGRNACKEGCFATMLLPTKPRLVH